MISIVETSKWGRRETSGSHSLWKTLVLLVLLAAFDTKGLLYQMKIAMAFQTRQCNGRNIHHLPRAQKQLMIKCNGSKNENEDSTGTKEDMDVVTKSSWYAVEWFGNTFGSKGQTESSDRTSGLAPSSLDETIQRINDDNDRYYFLSGEIDSLIYDVDCIFADPFVSFSGRDRFVQNLQNLGSFITKYDARVLKYSPVTYEDSIPIIETKIMVKLQLNLPWKPVLAWPWGVKYEIDPDTFLITKHEESWNIEPLEGVKMIFRPSKVNL